MPYIRPPRHGLAGVVLTSPLIMPPTDAFQGNSSNTSISAALLRVGSSTQIFSSLISRGGCRGTACKGRQHLH